ncbi:L-ornithine N(5)-monooxygenase [Lipomyces oligophaga]|uniref:L-ornithine N(5)-monooxygenase n=1 Tax=Lipomyces oligophaga TaxID=45792 RepID=UPI0034CDAC30
MQLTEEADFVGQDLSSEQSSNLGSLNHPYDLICLGFGPAALAIAISISETAPDRLSKTIFIEKQAQFTWHGGMLVPGSYMQISFLKDFATLRDPKSRFTFLNYLQSQNRLIDFINLGTFYPLREEYQDYMRWCACSFQDQVRYSEMALQVGQVTSGTSRACRPLDILRVISQSVSDGKKILRYAKNVVVCTGSSPHIPNCFPEAVRLQYSIHAAQISPHERLAHSSDFVYFFPRIKDAEKTSLKPIRIAVLGAGQSAAEITYYLLNELKSAHVDIIFRSRALRPSDDTAFVNEIFNPSEVDEFYDLSSSQKKRRIEEDRATNYSVVRVELIEKLYEFMYAQKLRGTRRLRILNHKMVRKVTDHKLLELQLCDAEYDGDSLHEQYEEYDFVIAATGYHKQARTEAILSSLHPLIKSSNGDHLPVDRNYRLQLNRDQITAGVWLQGSCENSHGLSDSLLSVMAVRGKLIVDQVFQTSC